MPEADRNAELLSSLRRLVRGLSALFWGLPIALVVTVQTTIGRGDWLKSFGFAPMACVMALLFYGTILLGRFQSQERIWINALERARLIALVNLGLSPFLFFWSKVPGNMFFTVMMELLFLTLLAFLYLLNSVLARLAAMLPDETLRSETHLFTRLNQTILLIIIPALPIYFLIRGASTLPRIVVDMMLLFERGGAILQMMLLMLFLLLPVAMTMALLWKTKEVIMAGVFTHLGPEQPPRIN
ncbi:MAG TPA: hypothetical protein VNT99_02495 [Methylomirabilota bacterium]|nr:hypothetical protein [Methylomirabilota bacterium]